MADEDDRYIQFLNTMTAVDHGFILNDDGFHEFLAFPEELKSYIMTPRVVQILKNNKTSFLQTEADQDV